MKGYEKLDDVLARAFKQASEGKGKERHANDLPFHEQPMQQVNRMVGVGFSHGQAIKKIVESQNMPPEQAVHELLGAICYIAGGIITLEAANDNADPQPEIYFEPIMKNETFEYLDHNFQLVEVEAGAVIRGDWRKVPKDAIAFIKQPNVWSGFISDMKHVGSAKILWMREAKPATQEQAREKARGILANMRRGEMANVYGRMISFNHQGLFVEGYWHSDSLKETLDYLFESKE